MWLRRATGIRERAGERSLADCRFGPDRNGTQMAANQQTQATNTAPITTPGTPRRIAMRLPSVRSSFPAFNSMMVIRNRTMMAPAYTITCTAATNSAPSRRYSAASAPITTISERALLMGWLCASRLIAPPRKSHRKREIELSAAFFQLSALSFQLSVNQV